jgi:chromosome partitioning protein
MRVYTLANQKGGVGKTTTGISLGAYLAQAGFRTLLVDLDPQANATSCLGIEHSQLAKGTYDVLIGSASVPEAVLHNPSIKMSLLPSSAALAGARIELVGMPDREQILRRALESIDGRFDYVLIDCPPSLGLLTLNGLIAASDGVIVPVQCEYLALEGLTQLMETLNRVRANLHPKLITRGLLLTMFDSRTVLSHQVAGEVRRHFGQAVFNTVIPRNIRLAEAPSYGTPISVYAPTSSGARAYYALAQEILHADGITDRIGVNMEREIK